jgi:hypothetical protein
MVLLLVGIITLSAIAGSVVRNIGGGPTHFKCSLKRSFRCIDETRDLLTHSVHTRDYDFEATRILWGVHLSEATRSCLRYQLFYIRRSVFVTPCVFDQLLRWNQLRPEGAHLQYSDFKDLAGICSDQVFRASACQIQDWYKFVFEPSIGKDLRSLGVHQSAVGVSSRSVRTGNFPVWAPDNDSAERIVRAEIQRLGRDSIVVAERSREDDDPDAWMDDLMDLMSGDVSEPILSLNGRLSPPPTSCLQPLLMSCVHEYERILQYLRDPSTIGRLSHIRNLVQDVPRKHTSCVYGAVGRFRNSILITPVQLEHILSLNSMNSPLTSADYTKSLNRMWNSCDLHLWYNYVINPNLGREVSSLGLREISLFPGGPSFSVPSGESLNQLINIELSRVREVV